MSASKDVKNAIAKIIEVATGFIGADEVARIAREYEEINKPESRLASRRASRRAKKAPKADSNIGLIHAYLDANANRIVPSAKLEKCLKTRVEPGERVSGDAASVCSNINYLRKRYGFDIETVRVGVYRLNKPTKRRA